MCTTLATQRSLAVSYLRVTFGHDSYNVEEYIAEAEHADGEEYWANWQDGEDGDYDYEALGTDFEWYVAEGNLL